MPQFDAILVASFGGPEGPDQVVPYLRNVAGGKELPLAVIEELVARYMLFGGVSPMKSIPPNLSSKNIVAVSGIILAMNLSIFGLFSK